MADEFSVRLAQLESGVSQYRSESLSCLQATKLSYIQATFERAKRYFSQDSMQLAFMLIAKAERVFTLFERGINAEKESIQAKLCQSEELDEQGIHPAKQFALLSQDIQQSRVTHAHTKSSDKDQRDLSERQPESGLQSFKQYQDMFEKMALDRLLTKVMQQIPENAGPLNPERLVIRSFKVLQSISPEYLNHLISYYESLLVLQTVNSTLK